MTAFSKPHLPKQLVKDLLKSPMMKGYQSWIFREPKMMEKTRQFFLCGEDKWQHHAHLLAAIEQSGTRTTTMSTVDYCFRQDFVDKRRFTALFMTAIKEGDVLLAFELVRLGVPIDLSVDPQAPAPFHVALDQLIITIGELSNKIDPEVAARALEDPQLQRYRAIVRLLIEQHAEISQCGLPAMVVVQLLYALVLMKDWELLALLLEHGFDHSAFPELLLSEVPTHLHTLFLDKKARPGRKCPCFSGSDLEDCHAAMPKPYPDEFACPCYSEKTYQSCCKTRKIVRWEVWNSKQKWIAVVSEHACPLPVPNGEPAALRRVAAQVKVMENNPAAREKCWRGAALYLRLMCAQGLVDPAFCFAYEKTEGNILPRPLGRSDSKEMGKTYQKAWNDAVDLYIARGEDCRPRFDIECAAKIRHSLGALHRLCENPGCGKLEGRDVDKLRVCSGCLMSVYCGRNCQTAAWKEHKKMCGDPSQLEQQLPSQINIVKDCERTCAGDSL